MGDYWWPEVPIVLLCTGSRECTNYENAGRALSALLDASPAVHVFHGACPKGFDKIVHDFFKDTPHPSVHEVHAIPAKWTALGTKAGMIRNSEMVELAYEYAKVGWAPHVLSFWDRESPGTKDCLIKAINKGFFPHVFPA